MSESVKKESNGRQAKISTAKKAARIDLLGEAAMRNAQFISHNIQVQ